MVGTSQLPSATISRAVTMLRDSMMSVGRSALKAKNVTNASTMKNHVSFFMA